MYGCPVLPVDVLTMNCDQSLDSIKLDSLIQGKRFENHTGNSAERSRSREAATAAGGGGRA